MRVIAFVFGVGAIACIAFDIIDGFDSEPEFKSSWGGLRKGDPPPAGLAP